MKNLFRLLLFTGRIVTLGVLLNYWELKHPDAESIAAALSRDNAEVVFCIAKKTEW